MAPRLDLVPDDDVEPGLGGSARKHARVAALQHGPGIPHGDEDVFLGGQAGEVRVGGGIRVADMTVRFHQPGHEGRAGPVDDASAGSGQASAPLDGGHPLAFYEHVSGEWRGPAAVEDRRIPDGGMGEHQLACREPAGVGAAQAGRDAKEGDLKAPGPRRRVERTGEVPPLDPGIAMRAVVGGEA